MSGLVRFSAPIVRAVFLLYPAAVAARVAFQSMTYSSQNRRCLSVNSFMAPPFQVLFSTWFQLPLPVTRLLCLTLLPLTNLVPLLQSLLCCIGPGRCVKTPLEYLHFLCT